ncbi:MAG TPA: response regulator [Bacteroidales bacterium]|nr:response regulator [Bacteroidales bacterium]
MEQEGLDKVTDSKLPQIVFDSDRKLIERLSYIALLSLIISVILLSFRLILPAGCLIIIAAAAGVMIVKKSLYLLRKTGESLNEVSTSSEKKDDVITDFSHRIREPLNNLVVIGDLLIESGLQKKQKELLETFIASTNNMVDTVNELTMQSAGTISYEERKKIRFNLVSTIQNTIDLFNLKDVTNIEFILGSKEMSLYEMIGDPIILKQIFLDLFNTIENQGGGRKIMVNISLKKIRETGSESFVNFRIQTNKDLILIDEKGLPGNLASKLIMSGKGYFHQEFGNNFTVLDFTLPFFNVSFDIRKHVVSPLSQEELRLREKPEKDLKDVSILLVEDNVINQKITMLTLKPLVSNIDTAVNGMEAVEKFENADYDLILMDIQMPVMSGLVAAEKIRAIETARKTHVPIIAITANAMLGDKERCLSAGMDDYISKPFQPAVLIDKLKKFI